MERIVLRHLKGSKAGQSEEFALNQHKELTFGREAGAQIKFDPDRDDVVGRVHAKLVQDPKDPYRFELTDLNSRNGTFLNRQRVSGSVAIAPGDVIQLGAGGPEIQFDLDPRPAHMVKSTRLAMGGTETAGSAAAATRVEGSVGSMGAPKSTVGKATVERMMTGVQSESRRNIMTVGGIAAALIAAVAIYQANATKKAKAAAATELGTAQADNQRQLDSLAAINKGLADRVGGLNSKEVFEKYSKAVVAVQYGWHLAYTRTGQQVYHRYVPNGYKDAAGATKPIMLDGRAVVAGYVAVGDDNVEPALTLDANSGWAVGQEGTGTGFVVTNDGFILTNRHIGSGWRTTYDGWAQLQIEGVLLTADGLVILRDGQPVIVYAPTNWVPSETGGASLQGGFEGVLDYMNVYFRGNTTPFRTNDQPRVSDRHDVALIKIASASSLPKVDLDFAPIEPGTRVSLMGYPSISVSTVVGVRSQEMFKKGPEVRIVPDPTLTGGMISKVVKGRQMTTDGKDPTYSPFGDVYQLDILATGGGNSGGPLINEAGKVVGIFFASRANPQSMERVTFAVPISFAKELITIDENVPLR